MSSGDTSGVYGIEQYAKLEQQLILLAWLNWLFGYNHNRELLEDLKDAEGFDSSGRSHICRRLESRASKIKIPLAALASYDDNIREHLDTINSYRSDRITLRYFQHLAVLYTEIFLDRYFHCRAEMLRSLNCFVEESNASKTGTEPNYVKFLESDLKKLAFWMATGSGKTLIMHINYRQFLYYNNSLLDNILLVTPNEGLSEQHMTEMTDSGIPCRRFDLNESGLMMDKKAVRVIEITKLVEQKRGGGETVPVDAFEGNNLIFVDEGHKGSGGEVWRRYRDALGETGFTFEYSATFGQALKASQNNSLTKEYGKSIIFDYSYRYFHGDGYGKDFRVLNLKEEATEDKTNMLLLGNLLSFYQQQRVFEEQSEALRSYNLEKPLWVFVGGTVNAVYTRHGQKRSDVLTVARFLHQVLRNSENWVVNTIKKLIEGNTGLVTPHGQDVFENKFKYLVRSSLSPDRIYRNILANVFHAPSGGGLHLCDIRGNSGEVGLKASGTEDYFGLIYIGDVSKFKNLVNEDNSGITLEEDSFASSLFDSIGNPDTNLNILIGAKKFMEGWNSWRVSNMGLLNIGRNEGSEIIQLFGRGVRLRGKEFSLKRSAALDGKHPDHIGLLETLNIFAVRANYMSQFREYLEKEGVETEDSVEFLLKIKSNQNFLNRGLVVPRIPTNRSFVEEENIVLEPDSSIQVAVDMSLKAQYLESGQDGMMDHPVHTGQEKNIPRESLDLVNWEKVYLDLLEYKEQKGLSNLAIFPDTPKMIIGTSDPNRLYKLIIADESVVAPKLFADTAVLHEAIVSILRKYMEKFYRVRQERWDSHHMIYTEIDDDDANFQDYTVKITHSEASAIQKLIEKANSIYREDKQELPTIHFDRHLYQPLLIKRGDKVKSSPPGLNESEHRFVEDLRKYCKYEKNKSLAGKDVYLLRNQSRGKGVGFFEKRGFYPDFILWIKDSSVQRIVFIEPHGMIHAESYEYDDKARLWESLPKLAEEIGKNTKINNVILDSFIISATPYEYLRKKYGDGWDKERFTKVHILFPEPNYLAHVMESSYVE